MEAGCVPYTLSMGYRGKCDVKEGLSCGVVFEVAADDVRAEESLSRNPRRSFRLANYDENLKIQRNLYKSH